MKNNYPCKGTELNGLYPIGLQFNVIRGMRVQKKTLKDIEITTSVSTGKVIKTEYMTVHDLGGQIVSELVAGTTIARSTIVGKV